MENNNLKELISFIKGEDNTKKINLLSYMEKVPFVFMKVKVFDFYKVYVGEYSEEDTKMSFLFYYFPKKEIILSMRGNVFYNELFFSNGLMEKLNNDFKFLQGNEIRVKVNEVVEELEDDFIKALMEKYPNLKSMSSIKKNKQEIKELTERFLKQIPEGYAYNPYYKQQIIDGKKKEDILFYHHCEVTTLEDIALFVQNKESLKQTILMRLNEQIDKCLLNLVYYYLEEEEYNKALNSLTPSNQKQMKILQAVRKSEGKNFKVVYDSKSLLKKIGKTKDDRILSIKKILEKEDKVVISAKRESFTSIENKLFLYFDHPSTKKFFEVNTNFLPFPVADVLENPENVEDILYKGKSIL